VLHGEQYTELKRPLPMKATLKHKARISDIFDKGKNALVVTEVKSFDETGEELVRNEVTTFVRGAGGWGGDRGPAADVNVPPDRAPDKDDEDRTSENQALLYRLSVDWNPLHADPAFAKAFGFAKPILHGLCSFGFATRHVAKAFAPDGNPDFVKSIKVRFASTVLPGETLVTEMWKESDTRIIFRTKVKERGEIVISNAAVELWKELPKPKDRHRKPAGRCGRRPGGAEQRDIFRAIGTFVRQPRDRREGEDDVPVQAVQPDSAWTIDLTTPPGTVTEGVGQGRSARSR
jgi:3-hydroxyacyl-CoA dehydrogenase/3a,7a,12a-trihydroxy-5b-cholest-24-enoyl-CoA hydratase